MATTEGLTIGQVYERAHKGVVEITAGGGSARAQVRLRLRRRGPRHHEPARRRGASSISVRFSDGSTHSAELVGTDPSTDLAVIRVDAPQSLLEPLRLGDSGEVAVGDAVVAMGARSASRARSRAGSSAPSTAR